MQTVNSTQPADNRSRMAALCQAIPALATMPECAEWNAELLAHRWASASSGEKAAIQFVLNVWNDDVKSWQEEFGVPPFTLADFARLSQDNQAPIAQWYARPFWP